jgi:hypothetical protein
MYPLLRAPKLLRRQLRLYGVLESLDGISYQRVRRCHLSGTLPSVAKGYGFANMRNRFLHLFAHEDAESVCDDVLRAGRSRLCISGRGLEVFPRARGTERGTGPGRSRKGVGVDKRFGRQDDG